MVYLNRRIPNIFYRCKNKGNNRMCDVNMALAKGHVQDSSKFNSDTRGNVIRHCYLLQSGHVKNSFEKVLRTALVLDITEYKRLQKL